ncbi:hypothetical protein yc1106_09164 [Curvularia clavata]|uniref:Uncharacterized protein n=1 Tax=Curvularia clavata TaxID=95742 RepID=A0A9Q8ZHP7_CURCL|nr:hypothetical protein yc1106_09164 [Curvularia clavata]
MANVDEIDETYGTDESYETDETNDYEYSREEAITVIRDYYQFLCTMYMDESMIQEPPEGGWTSIPDGWTDFDKTEEVLELLRHLPYLNFKVMGAPDCRFMNWHTGLTNWNGEKLKLFTEILPEEGMIPPHIVGLTFIMRYTPAILLDTELGVIYWHDPPGEIMTGYGSFGEATSWAEDGLIPEDQVEWRESSCFWLFQHFFEMLKNKFRTLEFVPFGRHQVESMWPFIQRNEEKQRLLEAIQEVYRDHGWPDMTRFRKEDCLADIDAMVKARFPDFEEDYHDTGYLG